MEIILGVLTQIAIQVIAGVLTWMICKKLFKRK